MPANARAKSSYTSPSDRTTGAVSIADVLNMTVAQARAFFDAYPGIVRMLSPLEEVGLSYMRLGQPLPTLSGGEAQRLKLAGYLAEKNSASATGSLFLFDEPTTGLHFSDIAVLLKALLSLVDRGNTVVIIEHNLDVIAAADWIIDLGPEGGQAGDTRWAPERPPTSGAATVIRPKRYAVMRIILRPRRCWQNPKKPLRNRARN